MKVEDGGEKVEDGGRWWKMVGLRWLLGEWLVNGWWMMGWWVVTWWFNCWWMVGFVLGECLGTDGCWSFTLVATMLDSTAWIMMGSDLRWSLVWFRRVLWLLAMGEDDWLKVDSFCISRRTWLVKRLNLRATKTLHVTAIPTNSQG